VLHIADTQIECLHGYGNGSFAAEWAMMRREYFKKRTHACVLIAGVFVL
jgi:hypothetical protein